MNAKPLELPDSVSLIICEVTGGRGVMVVMVLKGGGGSVEGGCGCVEGGLRW